MVMSVAPFPTPVPCRQPAQACSPRWAAARCWGASYYFPVRPGESRACRPDDLCYLQRWPHIGRQSAAAWRHSPPSRLPLGLPWGWFYRDHVRCFVTLRR